MHANLAEMLETSAAVHGDRPLFGYCEDGHWKWLTYAQTRWLVDRLRSSLAKIGIRQGDRVAIISDNRWEWAVTAYACFGLGAAIVPMYEAQSPAEWKFILEDSGAKAVFASKRVFETVQSLAPQLPGLAFVFNFDDRLFLKMASTWLPPQPRTASNSGELAFIMYTSGTTGKPKGVMLTHEGILANIQAVLGVIRVSEQDRSVAFLPWAHCFANTAELNALIAVGGSIAICRGLDFILADIAEHRPTLLFAVPKIFCKVERSVRTQIAGKPKPIQKLFAAGHAASLKARSGQPLGVADKLARGLADRLIFSKVRAKLGGNLRFAVSGGAPLPKESGVFLQGLGIEIFEGYGMTETSPIISVNYPGHRRFGSVGKPLPTLTVRVAHAEDVPGDEGEIQVQGPNVMRGYYQRAEETDAAFTPDGWLRTGDLGRLDEDGFLHLTGRLKEQYKLDNGKYVVPGPIEDALKRSSFVANVFVYGDGRPYNVALVVPDKEAVTRLADANGLVAETYADLLRDAAVVAHFEKEIDQMSSDLRKCEKIRRFELIEEDFTKENGLLTQTLKVKRNAVVARWKANLDELYVRK